MKYAASIIIPTYNRSQLLAHTLTSLTKQSQQSDTFEVIVVDDGSSDNTPEVVASYGDRLNITYFFQEDRGFQVAKARNVGIVNAQSDICIFIDSGILLSSQCVLAHIKSHQQENVPLAVIGYVYGFGTANDQVETLQNMAHPSHVDKIIARFQLTHSFLDRREPFYQKYHDTIELLPAPWISFWTCNVSVSRQALLTIDGFDENFQSWGVEDTECGYRLFETGVKFILNRQAAAVHAPHEKDRADNRKTGYKNMLYFHKKHRVQNALVSEYFLTSPWDQLNDRLLQAQQKA